MLVCVAGVKIFKLYTDNMRFVLIRNKLNKNLFHRKGKCHNSAVAVVVVKRFLRRKINQKWFPPRDKNTITYI